MSYTTEITIETPDFSFKFETGTRRIGLQLGCKFPDDYGRSTPVVIKGLDAKHMLEKISDEAIGYSNKAVVNVLLLRIAQDYQEYVDGITSSFNLQLSLKLVG